MILNFSSIIKIDSALQVDMKNPDQQVNYLRFLFWMEMIDAACFLQKNNLYVLVFPSSDELFRMSD